MHGLSTMARMNADEAQLRARRLAPRATPLVFPLVEAAIIAGVYVYTTGQEGSTDTYTDSNNAGAV